MIPFCCYLLQKVSEKVGGAEGTKLDDDFKEMERVSLHFLAFPWHQVVPYKKEMWSCSVLETPNVLFLKTKQNKKQQQQQKSHSFHCVFWNRNWKASCLLCPCRDQNYCEEEGCGAIFLGAFVISFLVRVLCVDCAWIWVKVESKEKKMENDVSNHGRILSLWLQWSFLWKWFLQEAGQDSEERAVWESSWPGQNSALPLF